MASSRPRHTFDPCPADPAKYRDHLARLLNLQPNGGVIDLTRYIDCGVCVTRGVSGQVHMGRWKGVDESIVHDAQILPPVTVTVILLSNLKEQNRSLIMQRELKILARINHRNILPLIGFAHIGGDPNFPALISPWVKNGTVMEYLRNNLHSSPFGFLRGIIRGLHYLHTFYPGIVHGDIKAANVLVSHSEQAYLCDFGLNRLSGDDTLREAASSAPGTMPWMAPELLAGDVKTVTKEADIYAYGMTCWEILAGQVPFKSIHEATVITKVINGERPERILSRHPDKIWQIITRCWMHDPSDRPTTSVVLLLVEDAVACMMSENANGESPIQHNHALSPIQGDTTHGANSLADAGVYCPCPTNPALYRDHLALTLNLQPSSGVIDLSRYIDRGEYVTGGAFGQVHKGRWKGVDESIAHDPRILPLVAVKVILLPKPQNQNEQNKRYRIMQRERELWARISHDNILPLIGFAHIDGNPNMPAFISPWVENGNVIEYLRNNPHSSPFGFLHDIIKGLHYLHTFNPEIVHGDIKAANVLVNYRKEAYICDFGLSRFAVDSTLWRTTASVAPGTMRWMAPELLTGNASTVTKEADIYAYGMTCWEILAGQVPFKSIHDAAVIIKVINGERPECIVSRHPDKIWQIITRCWTHDPNDRPTTSVISLLVEDAVVSIASENANPGRRPLMEEFFRTQASEQAQAQFLEAAPQRPTSEPIRITAQVRPQPIRPAARVHP